MPTKTNRLLTVKELAEYLHCSPATIWQNWTKWRDKYNLTVIRINGNEGGKASLRFKKSEIDKMLESWQI